MSTDIEQGDVGVTGHHPDVLVPQAGRLGGDLGESPQDALPHLAGTHG